MFVTNSMIRYTGTSYSDICLALTGSNFNPRRLATAAYTQHIVIGMPFLVSSTYKKPTCELA